MVHPNKSPLKLWGKKESGRIEGLPKFFEFRTPWLGQERVKLRTSNLVCTFLVSIGTEAEKPIKNFGKNSRGWA